MANRQRKTNLQERCPCTCDGATETKACEGWITNDPDDTPKGTCGIGTNIASTSGTCPTGPGRATEAVGGYLSPLLLSGNPGYTGAHP